MDEDTSRRNQLALINGTLFALREVIPHALGQSPEIVLCVDALSKQPRYLSAQEWADGHAAYKLRMQAGPPSTTASSSKEYKLALFRSLFCAHSQPYAHGYWSGKNNKIQYAPACAHELSGLCKKPCRNCPNQAFPPLSDAALLAHFNGRSETFRDVIGVYPLDEDSRTKFLAIDLDDADWKDSTAALRKACAELGVVPAIERSRSGNGAHIWFFFEEQLDAALARKFGAALLTKAMQLGRVGFTSYDRMFPAQDLLPKGGFGNLIALPFQGRARNTGSSLFVDETFKPYEDQWAFLSSLPLLKQADLERVVKKSGTGPLGSLASNEARPKTETATPRKRSSLSTADLPEQVLVTRSSALRIPKEGLSPRAADAVRRLAVFANQDFYRAQNMRQSVFGKPRVLDYGCEDEASILLPRGCRESLLALLTKAGANVAVSDERHTGRPIDVEFVGRLRPEQSTALDALLEHDDGILVAPTGFGKTVVAAALIAKRKVNTLVIVSSLPLLNQWVEKLPSFLKINEEPQVVLTKTGRRSKLQPGMIGTIAQSKELPGGIIDIALYQSLLEPSDIRGAKLVKDLVSNYGMVIVDECHHAPATQLSQVLLAVPAKYLYGLTATPRRDDGKTPAVTMLCGPIRHDASIEEQIKSQGFKRLLCSKFLVGRRESGPGLDKTGTDAPLNELIDAICCDKNRNSLIISDVCELLDAGRTPLVLTKRVDHARMLAKLLEQAGRRTVLLIGSAPKDERAKALDELSKIPASERFAIVATGGYVGEGFDDVRLDSLLLACPVSFDHVVKQYVGRLHRERDGKTDVRVYDYVDLDYPMFANMYRKRLKAYASLGYTPFDDNAAREAATVLSEPQLTEGIAQDIKGASREISISSSAAAPRSSSVIMEALRAAVARGIEVKAILKETSTAAGRKRLERTESLLTDFGLVVRKMDSVVDGIVIDDQVVWIGSLVPLGRRDDDASALRMLSPSVAKALSKTSIPT